MVRPVSELVQGNGRHLSEGQLRQLQWIVPRPWAAEAVSTLSTLPLAGARVRALAGVVEHWVGFFDGLRMVEEALRPEAYPLLSERGLLPVGGCGKRGVSVYFIDVASADVAMWLTDEGAAPQPLGVGLGELWAASEPEARVQLRRRLPEKAPRRLAKTRPRPRPLVAAAAACERTLPLFA